MKTLIKTIIIAAAITLAAPVMAFDWKTVPAAEFEDTYDTNKAAKQAAKEYKKGTLREWLDRVTGWKQERIDANKQDIKEAKAAKKAGDLTKEEFKEIKAEEKAMNKELNSAKKEAKRSARQAARDAKKDAKSRVEK